MPRPRPFGQRRSTAPLIAAIVICGACALRPLPVIAEETPVLTNAPGDVDFARDIAPLLVRNCLGCHAGADPAGGLNLSSRDGAFAGGESGLSLVAAKPDDSPLLDRVRSGEMPPPEKGPRLSERETAQLTAWVAAGAAWPEGRLLSPYEYTTDKRAGLDWWSLKPPVPPQVP